MKIVINKTCSECLKNNPFIICQVVFCPCETLVKEAEQNEQNTQKRPEQEKS